MQPAYSTPQVRAAPTVIPSDIQPDAAAYWRQRYETEKTHSRAWERKAKTNWKDLQAATMRIRRLEKIIGALTR